MSTITVNVTRSNVVMPEAPIEMEKLSSFEHYGLMYGTAGFLGLQSSAGPRTECVYAKSFDDELHFAWFEVANSDHVSLHIVKGDMEVIKDLFKKEIEHFETELQFLN